MKKTNGKRDAVGRIVHYVMEEGSCRGAHRAALVLGSAAKEPEWLDLLVFPSPLDHIVTGFAVPIGVWKTCVRMDEKGRVCGTWHEREDE